MQLNTIFFIGPQGSGKGTQAKFLAKRLGFFSWDMGATLREVAASSSILGIQIKSQIDSGVLLKDEDLYQVIKAKLSEIPISKGVIFDGIPRRLGQAEFLLSYLKEQGRTNFTTLHVSLPSEESLARLLKRGEIEKRADDTKEKIEFRLKQYEEETIPVLQYLKANTNFFEIDGRPNVAEVRKQISKDLKISDGEKIGS